MKKNILLLVTYYFERLGIFYVFQKCPIIQIQQKTVVRLELPPVSKMIPTAPFTQRVITLRK